MQYMMALSFADDINHTFGFAPVGMTCQNNRQDDAAYKKGRLV